MRRVLILFALLLVAACAGPRPLPPPAATVEAPVRWRSTLPPSRLADLSSWLEGFGDPVLVRLVNDAIAHNDDVAIAASRVEEARAQFRLAQSQRRPDITGGLAIQREREINPGFGVPELQTAEGAQFGASYDLDLFGRLQSASEAARASMLASAAARETVRLALIAGVTKDYFALRGLDARLEILKQTVSAREDELRFARRRTDVGYASSLEFDQAEAAYRGALQLIPATQKAIKQQESALSVLTGTSPRDIARGSDYRSITVPPSPSLLPSELLTRRPDLIQAQQTLVAADASLDAARAAFLPNITLSALGGYVDSTLIDPTHIFSIGGSVLAPILDGGRLQSQQEGAAARRDQAAFAYRRAALNAFRDVEDALAGVEHGKTYEEAVDAQVAALTNVFSRAKTRYRAGYSPYLEQLDAQRALLSAQLASVQARIDRLEAAASLYQALGGGWTPAEILVSVTSSSKENP